MYLNFNFVKNKKVTKTTSSNRLAVNQPTLKKEKKNTIKKISPELTDFLKKQKEGFLFKLANKQWNKNKKSDILTKLTVNKNLKINQKVKSF